MKGVELGQKSVSMFLNTALYCLNCPCTLCLLLTFIMENFKHMQSKQNAALVVYWSVVSYHKLSSWNNSHLLSQFLWVRSLGMAYLVPCSQSHKAVVKGVLSEVGSLFPSSCVVGGICFLPAVELMEGSPCPPQGQQGGISAALSLSSGQT